MAGYGFKFMACVIPNHFRHADGSDHSLYAIARLYNVKLHLKLYKIGIYRDLVLGPY